MASSQGRESEAERRRQRLAIALRENLRRRKAVQRDRVAKNRSGEPVKAPETAINLNTHSNE